MGPLYGVPLKEGDGCTLTVSTYANGDVRATVYEYDRMPGVLLVLCLFFAATELVSGISSSIGIILSVPLTAAICSGAYGKGAR